MVAAGKLDFQEVQLVTSGAAGVVREVTRIHLLGTFHSGKSDPAPHPLLSYVTSPHVSVTSVMCDTFDVLHFRHICHMISKIVSENIQNSWSGRVLVKECNPKTSSTLSENVKCETANVKKFSANRGKNIASMRRLQLIN